MGAEFPSIWQRALTHRQTHFDITADTTLRLLHGEDLRVRCDRFGAVAAGLARQAVWTFGG